MNKLKVMAIATCLMLVPLVVSCDDNSSSNSAEEERDEAVERAIEESNQRAEELNAEFDQRAGEFEAEQEQRELDAALSECEIFPAFSEARNECQFNVRFPDSNTP